MAVRKRRTGLKRRQRGGANWRDLLKRGHNYVKSNKIASKALSSMGFNRAAKIADILGYGKQKRRVTRRRQRGGFIAGALMSGLAKGLLQKGLQAAKDNKLASKALNSMGHTGAANMVGALGFGRSRRRRRQRGGAWYNTLWRGIKSGARAVGNFVVNEKPISKILSAFPDGRAQIAANVAGNLGLGKQRKTKRKPVRNIRGGSAMRAGANIVNPYILIR